MSDVALSLQLSAYLLIALLITAVAYLAAH